MFVSIGTVGGLRSRCPSFFFQAEDGIRDLVRSRGLGDVYKRQPFTSVTLRVLISISSIIGFVRFTRRSPTSKHGGICLLYTSDAADERSSVDLGGRRIIKKKYI